MGLLNFFCRCFLRVFVYLLHCSISCLSGLLSGEQKELPPIRDPILLLPATEIAKKIRTKQLKSLEVVEAYINRIKDVQPIINAVVEQRYDSALQEAQKVDELIETGAKSEEELERSYPLLGVPFSCKEAIALKGFPHTAGVVIRKGIVAEADSEVVRRFRNAGAIPLVCTNTAEYCMSWNSGNHLYGTTKNAYDNRRMAGGSSGGEGALVSAAGSVIGIGSDLGGSVRIPACLNGIFGHKPSRNASPITGYYPEPPEAHHKFWNTGPLCRYAYDLPLVMKVISGQDANLKLDENVELRNLKIYYSSEDGNPLTTSVVPELKNALNDVLTHFKKEYEVTSQNVHFEALKDSFTIWLHALDEADNTLFEKSLTNSQGKQVNLLLEILKWCVRLSDHTAPALAYAFYQKHILRRNPKCRKQALQKIVEVEKNFAELLADENCVFLYPTHPEPAPYDAESVPKFFNVGYTAIFNVLGLPVTQVPLVLCQGLPVGIQVVSRLNNDRVTIAVAKEIEKKFGGWTCPGPIITNM